MDYSGTCYEVCDRTSRIHHVIAKMPAELTERKRICSMLALKLSWDRVTGKSLIHPSAITFDMRISLFPSVAAYTSLTGFFTVA